MVTLDELHAFAVEEGIKEDPRDPEQIEDELERRKEAYEELDGVRKEAFDEDRLENPFDDCKVLYGGDQEVDTVAVGIDIETQELVLVDRLNDDGADIDGVIAHHPEGASYARLYEVMDLNIDTLHQAGVPISQAEAVVRPSIKKVKYGLHPRNHMRSPRAADLLGLPFMSLHTITDNHARRFMKDYLENREMKTLGGMVEEILELEEYQWALEYGAEPEIFVGQEDNRIGNWTIGFTGGTPTDKEKIEKLVDSGIDTVVDMHMKEDVREEAEEHNLNVVIAGHMASDSLGMNLLLDKVQDEFSLDVVELSGFKRVER